MNLKRNSSDVVTRKHTYSINITYYMRTYILVGTPCRFVDRDIITHNSGSCPRPDVRIQWSYTLHITQLDTVNAIEILDQTE